MLGADLCELFVTDLLIKFRFKRFTVELDQFRYMYQLLAVLFINLSAYKIVLLYFSFSLLSRT